MKHILMIATGGTIASKETAEGLAPALTSGELLDCVPEIARVCRVDAVQPFNLDSTNVYAAHWLQIARIIEENYAKYDGFVVTHGTDTMAYTAAALSYLVQDSAKPIVLTGDKVTKGQTVEIRCELKKTGDFANTLYTIRYFQFEGDGTLKMDNGITFLPNDRYLLENEKFRLYYTAQGDEAHNFIVVVEDNFGNSYELEFDFNNRNVKDDGVITVVPIGNFKPLTR